MLKFVHPLSTTAPIIATGEMWGNHCEKWYGERHYGGALPRNVLSNMQGTFFRNDGSPTIFYAGEDTDFIFGLNAN